jgi:Mg2+/Co2+ transporter CorC
MLPVVVVGVLQIAVMQDLVKTVQQVQQDTHIKELFMVVVVVADVKLLTKILLEL